MISVRQSSMGMAVLLALLVAAAQLSAQTAPTPAPATPAPAAPATPSPAPEPAAMPAWPVNQAPEPAVVQWDSHGLKISAKNSSLKQILADVAVRIGAKLEGMGADERVFGEYGPAPAKEVLAELLQGSAYNVMLIGDQGQGTPREIVLSTRVARGATQANAAQPVQNNSDDDSSDSDADESPVRTVPLPRPQMNPPPQMPNQPPQ
jgi:hypothetical protein